MANIQKTVAQYAVEITKALKTANDSILKASKLYVKCIDANKDNKIKLKNLVALPETVFSNMERIGRGQMDQRLLVTHNRAETKLLSMPLSQQKKALDDGIDVLMSNNAVLRVKPVNLTPSQVKQVFASDHIRDKAEQKNYLEEQKKIREYAAVIEPKKEEKQINKRPVKPFEIKAGKLIVNEAKTFDRKELFDILSKMV